MPSFGEAVVGVLSDEIRAIGPGRMFGWTCAAPVTASPIKVRGVDSGLCELWVRIESNLRVRVGFKGRSKEFGDREHDLLRPRFCETVVETLCQTLGEHLLPFECERVSPDQRRALMAAKALLLYIEARNRNDLAWTRELAGHCLGDLRGDDTCVGLTRRMLVTALLWQICSGREQEYHQNQLTRMSRVLGDMHKNEPNANFPRSPIFLLGRVELGATPARVLEVTELSQSPYQWFLHDVTLEQIAAGWGLL